MLGQRNTTFENIYDIRDRTEWTTRYPRLNEYIILNGNQFEIFPTSVHNFKCGIQIHRKSIYKWTIDKVYINGS